jgi:acyl dehydratase
MAVSESLVDKAYPPLPAYVVGREKVREFARATFATDPAHHDVEVATARGFGDVLAPATFPVVIQQAALDMLVADPEAGIDFSRVVHGDQRFDYHREVVAGDELTATLRVVKVQSLGGHTMVTAEVAMSDQAGLPVVTATSTLVIRGDDH